jgi:SAM-dependent methyltransferase
MIPYSTAPQTVSKVDQTDVYNFVTTEDHNVDMETVNSFGAEWEAFHEFGESDIKQIGSDYFDIVDERHISKKTVALDVGCGSGRWSKFLAPKVGFIEAIDPSEAVFSALKLTKNIPNLRITRAGVDSIPFPDDSFDFVFSLGVLHHIPDTAAAMKSCVRKLKPGGHFLVYLYYSLDNRSAAFKAIFRMTNGVRKVICRMPTGMKNATCNVIGGVVYWPLARFSNLMRKMGSRSAYKKIPLSWYGDKSFYIMRNDALDRFGTPLEQRFSKVQIERMMKDCGLTDIIFSPNEPYWHAIGRKA